MIGKTLAHYEITSMLGKGGMGEVFRARDTKLGREVALKVLPRELSTDPERAARFQREARSLAMLQHPNVASIYGFEEAEGIRFLVMELVDGEDLATRLQSGPIRIEDARRIAKQMAAGLEAAHETGLVHRDLKPANVMLTAEGEAKILDFGLARAWFGDQNDSGNIEASPTITAAMTQAGTILGTAAYMSPEQARGRNVDRRADIWAFGVILWEMVTGEKLFEGETISDTLAAVLRAEPDWDKLPVDDAPDLCQLIERCLVRDPKQRLRDIGEARLLLDGGASMTRLSMPRVDLPDDFDASATKSNWALTAVAALVALVAGLGIGWKLMPTEEIPEAPVLHTMIPSPPETEFDLGGAAPGPARLSPTGRMVTFTAIGEDGVTRLYLRHLDRSESVALPGTDDAAYPFWSPDDEFIGFFVPSDGKLKKVAIAGGPPVTLCTAANGKGGSWSPTGTIVFAPSHDSGLFSVPDIGGEPDTLTVRAEGIFSHRHPRFLPDGERFLFVARTTDTADLHQVLLGSLDGTEPRVLGMSECQAEYNSGHLMIAKEGNLLATPFDLETAEFRGGGFPLVEQIMISSSGSASGSYSFSDAGMMTYQTGNSLTTRVLEWVSLDNQSRASLPTTGAFGYPQVSPDGLSCTIEVENESDDGTDLWMVDLTNGLRTRFTFEAGDEMYAVWEPDGQAVLYVARGEDGERVLRQPIDSTSGAEVLYEGLLGEVRLDDVSPDGQTLLMSRQIDGTGYVSTLALDGSGEPKNFDNNGEDQGGGRYSRDGKWIAYHAVSANRWDVFVRPTDGSPRRFQVSTMGAVWPQWSAESDRLYVCGFNGTVTEYPIQQAGERLIVGSPTVVANVRAPSAQGVEFSVDPNGGRFLGVADESSQRRGVSMIHLVTDWRRGLSR